MTDDGFLVPPPGIAVTPAEPKPEPTPVTEQDFISLPPGIAAPDLDSGTRKVDTVRRSSPEAGVVAEPVFFPAGAPGIPPAAPVAAPITPVVVVSPAVAPAESDSVDDATRASVAHLGAPSWRLGLPDGRQVVLERTTLVGRDPAHSDEWADARLLPAVDPGKSVSKTHAAFELTAEGQALVHDLNSTNGVYLRFAGGDEIDVIPGMPQLLEPGVAAVLGEFTITVERS